jgi:hypothetical protein
VHSDYQLVGKEDLQLETLSRVTAPPIEGHRPKKTPRSLANYPAGTRDPFVGRESKDGESRRFTGQLPGDCGNRERRS